MLNQKTGSLLCLLPVLITCYLPNSAAHIGNFQVKPSDNQGCPTPLETLWMEILEEQKEADQAVLISNSANQVPHGITNGYTLVEPNMFNDEFMAILHDNMIKSNINPIYLITDTHINDVNRQAIIEIIRNHNKRSNIFTFWYEPGVPTYISLNLFFISPNLQDPQIYSIHETYAYCSHGNHSIKLNNVWSPNTGFRERLSLLSSFKGSFYNATLVAGCHNIPSVFARIGIDKSGKSIWSGYMYDMMVLLGKRMQFNLDVVVSGDPGEVLDGKPTGMIKLLSEEKVDIGADYFYPTWDRYKFIDFSVSYLFAENVIVTDEPPRGLHFFSFLQPFPALVWFLIAFSVPVVAGALYVINRFSPGQDQNLQFSECVWQVASVILWDTTNLKTPSPGTIILLLSYLLSCFIIITLFISECTSLMTKQPYKYSPINSLEQFIQYDLKWIGNNGDARTNWLKNSGGLMRSRHVHQGGKGIPSVINALDMMLDEPSTYIFPCDRPAINLVLNLYYRDINREHQFYISDKPFGSSGLVLFLQKHTSYQDTFNMHLLHLQQFGIVSKLTADTTDKYERIGRAKAKHENRLPKPKPPDTIQLKHMFGSFVFFGMGLALALFAFLAEHLHFHLWVLGPGSRRY